MAIIRSELGNFWTYSVGTLTLIGNIIVVFICVVAILSACWYLFRGYQQDTSPIGRRHKLYILIGFLVTAIFYISLFSMFFDLRVSLLVYIFRALIVAAFEAIIGIAIIKERLLDITIVIKKTSMYSILMALIIFVFSFSEHMLATYVGEIFGEHSIFIHLISIAVVIVVLMPVRHKVERAIERFFARKKVEF